MRSPLLPDQHRHRVRRRPAEAPRALRVVDEGCFDALGRRDGDEGLDRAGDRPREDAAGGTEPPVRPGQAVLDAVEGREAHAGLQRGAEDEGGAAGVDGGEAFGAGGVEEHVEGVGGGAAARGAGGRAELEAGLGVFEGVG